MTYSTIETVTHKNFPLLKAITIIAGISFLIIGLGLMLLLAFKAYEIVSQPEIFNQLIIYAKTQEALFAKWVSSGNIKSIELSNTFSLLIIVIALSMILRVIIGFISMCVNSGKGLLSLARNMD